MGEKGEKMGEKMNLGQKILLLIGTCGLIGTALYLVIKMMG